MKWTWRSTPAESLRARSNNPKRSRSARERSCPCTPRSQLDAGSLSPLEKAGAGEGDVEIAATPHVEGLPGRVLDPGHRAALEDGHDVTVTGLAQATDEVVGEGGELGFVREAERHE